MCEWVGVRGNVKAVGVSLGVFNLEFKIEKTWN